MIRDFMGMLLKRCAVEAVTWLLGVSLQCLLIADAQVRGSVAVDREALEALYHATGGPDWRNRAYWLSEAPLGEWFGVVTDSNGRVTSLALPGNGLSGAIPPELGDLTNLQEMYLWGNELIGAIPPELGDLTNLQVLWLGHNELIGAIPPELGDLTNLQVLDLGSNELIGAIPPELAALTNLRLLRLESNELIGAIPPELGDLTNLQGLYLGGNQLSGKIPGDLMQLSELTTLTSRTPTYAFRRMTTFRYGWPRFPISVPRDLPATGRCGLLFPSRATW